MKISIRFLIVGLLLQCLLSIAVLPAMSSSTSIEAGDRIGVFYTESELQTLYAKYNITENDIKFARGELPNFLDGTVLRSDTRIVVTEDGKPLGNLEESTDYDMILSEAEMLNIIRKAEREYMEKYGVNPSNPKLDVINGYVLPKEEAFRLLNSGKVSLDKGSVVEEQPLSFMESASIVSSVPTNPRAINGILYVHIYPAKDSRHAPIEAYYQDTIDATNRFEFTGVDVSRVWHYNYWNATVSQASNASAVLADLLKDTTYVRDQPNDIVLGWAHDLDHNGVAKKSGSFSVCSDTTILGFDWPHDSIVQHEISHNFDTSDHYTVDCIMDYEDAYQGIDIWCYSCRNIVYNGIYN
jgi:hypothetical protein